MDAIPGLPATPEIRQIGPDDRDALRRFYADLSPDNWRARFHGTGNDIGDARAARFCGPDHRAREGLLAVVRDPRSGASTIIGHLCLEPVGPREMEMAVAVADAWHRQGIGKALLLAAIDWSRTAGVEVLRASMLTSNAGIHALIRSIGYPVVFSSTSAGTFEAQIEIGAALAAAA